MSKKKKQKKQSIVISIISTIILLGIILLGSNFNKTEEFNNFIKANNLIENQTEGNLENLIVYFIDVGQADSILIKNQDDTLLIDAGNNEDGQDVVNFIKGKGITKLNYVIGTHPHEDHIGGLDDVINSDLKIENLWMPKIQTNTKTFEDVLDAVKNKGLKVTAPNKGDSFEIGRAKCEVMTDSILNKDNLNLSSIVIRLEFENNSFLFMGDAETANEKTRTWMKTDVLKVGHHGSNTSSSEDFLKQINPTYAVIMAGKNNSFLFMGDAETANEKTRTWMKTDVLKVGHHGSNTSSSEDFLKQINPTYAVIMAGKNNSYGLPKQKILDRLAKIGAKVYRTDEEGTIMMISNGNNIEVKENT